MDKHFILENNNLATIINVENIGNISKHMFSLKGMTSVILY
jgi:hypothetical protein